MNTENRTKKDVKSLPKNKRNLLREKAYELMQNGYTAYATAKKLQLTIPTVYRWYKQFSKTKGNDIKESKRGPKPGSATNKLSSEQMREIKKIITDKTPDQLKFKFALWSSKAIVELIREKYGIEVSRRSARRYMKKLGFTYQCPIKRAREQNSAQVNTWLNCEYPKIKEEAMKTNAMILWADESCVQAHETKVRGYSPKGVSPVLRAPVNRSIQCNMISAIGNKGDLFFMLFDGAMNTEKFTDFMTRLIKEMGRKIYLIVDNLKVHHATILNPWLEEHSNEIQLFYLPSYSPELNPDEYLNRDLKAALSEKNIPSTKDGLKSQVTNHLEMRKNEPKSVAKLFDKKEVQYAADK